MWRRATGGVVLACACFTLGCGGGGGTADAGNPGTGGTGGGSGGGDGTTSFDPAPFLGDWMEMLNVLGPGFGSCPVVLPPENVQGPITVSAGTSTDLVRSEPALGDCVVRLEIVTSTLAISQPFRCVTNAGTYDFMSWTFLLSSDGATTMAMESADGTLTWSGGDLCPIRLSTSLKR